MNIIKGIGNIQETAILTASGELLYSEGNQGFANLIEEECRKAAQEGEKRGEKIGYEKAKEEMQIHFTLLQRMTRKILEEKTRLLDAIKPEIVEFSLKLSEHLIRQELSRPESLIKLISSLLTVATTSVFEHDCVHVILAPEDLNLLGNHLSEIHFDRRAVGQLRFGSDPLMKRGDCRIEMKSGLLNYDIERELSHLQL